MSKTVEAWVLHKQWSGDTSARVTFYTRDLGLIHCLCKGGRTPKKQAQLQAFTPVWLSVEERYERFYAKTIESIAPTLHLQHHALFSALYLNELLYYVLSPNYVDSVLFDAYVLTLNGLALAKEPMLIESLLRRFEWGLLSSCGYSFSMTHEARTQASIEPDLVYQFVAGEGFIGHSKGILGTHILAMAESHFEDTASLRVAKVVMRQAIAHLLGGRTLKARALFLE